MSPALVWAIPVAAASTTAHKETRKNVTLLLDRALESHWAHFLGKTTPSVVEGVHRRELVRRRSAPGYRFLRKLFLFGLVFRLRW